MYEINLLETVKVSSERNQKLIKALKLLSLLLTFGVMAVCAYTYYTVLERDKVQEQIENLKMKIDETRRLNKIKEIENEWTLYYYKILAFKDLTANSTKTGLMFRDVGLYIPDGDFLCTFELTPESMINETVKIKGLADPKFEVNAYSDTVKEAYERSIYLGKDPITIGDRETLDIKGQKVEVLHISMPFVTEKK